MMAEQIMTLAGEEMEIAERLLRYRRVRMREVERAVGIDGAYHLLRLRRAMIVAEFSVIWNERPGAGP